MEAALEGQDISLWVATTGQPDNPPLAGDDPELHDVVVVGAGISGISVAHELQRRGLDVVLIEKGRLAEWTTGGTTAKLSAQHYLAYDYLIGHHGRETAQAYADANTRGIDRVEELAHEFSIDCDFGRRDAYIYSSQQEKLASFEAEVTAAESLGLPATLETETDLPLTIAGAVRFSDQAQFHPRKFLLGLAEQFVAAGGTIHEQTKAVDIEPGESCTVKTGSGSLRARHVVQASGEPFWQNDLFSDRMWLKMSYALGVELRGDYPGQMYLTTDQPMRTMRSVPWQDGQLLIFGGESHEYDDATYDEVLHYRNLIEDVHEKFDVERVHYRWLAGDYMPWDRIPFIGALPEHANVHVMTGYRAWGLAWALSAAEAVAAEISGSPESWAEPFGLQRLATPVADSERVHGI